MTWFKRKLPGLTSNIKKDIPDGLWIKCKECGEVIYKKQLEANSYVCTKCDYHFRITGNNYIKLLLDHGSFKEMSPDMESVDFLNFKDKKKYSLRLAEVKKKTGLKDAIRIGEGLINGLPVVFCTMDFSFIGGSMGSVVGEKISRAIEKAREKKLPLIIVSATGGARMMESIISLMQMAKTSSRLARFSEQGGLYISILTNPTTAGVVASYAMLGDIHIAEPGALIGFAGPRVIKQTIGQDLPEGFQSSSFQQEHGFVDLIVNRKDLKDTLYKIINFFIEDRGKMSERSSYNTLD
ncbi:acetyl-CoA carboxylase carboxyltransferase subunit beta [bacterium]|nr:acetyl-CoA carboxylase carboxyltransferase subunit beta [bacterium]